MTITIFSYSQCLLRFHGEFGCGFTSHSVGLQAWTLLPHAPSHASVMRLLHSVQLCSGFGVGGFSG